MLKRMIYTCSCDSQAYLEKWYFKLLPVNFIRILYALEGLIINVCSNIFDETIAGRAWVKMFTDQVTLVNEKDFRSGSI